MSNSHFSLTLHGTITIEGASAQDVKQALRQWIRMYADRLGKGFKFIFLKGERHKHFIVPNMEIENELFFYLINYLCYPEDISYDVQVKGFTNGGQGPFEGQQIMVYVPEGDKDYDLVSISTKNGKYFKFEFSGGIKEVDAGLEFQLPENYHFESTEEIVISTSNIDSNKGSKGTIKLPRTLQIMTVVIISAFLLTSLLVRNPEHLISVVYTLCIVVTGWFMFDYKILQNPEGYIVEFAIASFIFFFGIWIGSDYAYTSGILGLKSGTMMPLVFLLLQLPARALFKKWVMREPIVKTPMTNLDDGIYFILLGIGTILIPIFVVNLLD